MATETIQVELFNGGLEELTGLMTANLSGFGSTTTAPRLARVKGNKQQQWEITQGKAVMKTGGPLTGIIIGYATTRAFFSRNYKPGVAAKPDCSSPDAIHGVINPDYLATGPVPERTPSGLCADCPLNAFGTAQNGQGAGKACGEQVHLYLLPADQLFPLEILITPGNIGAFQAYLWDLVGKRRRFNKVITRITLTAVPDTDTYSAMIFENVQTLSDDQVAQVATYQEQMAPVLRAVPSFVLETPPSLGLLEG